MIHTVLTKVPNKLQTFFFSFCCLSMFTYKSNCKMTTQSQRLIRLFLLLARSFPPIQHCTIAMLFIQSEALLVYFISCSCLFSTNQHVPNDYTILCVLATHGARMRAGESKFGVNAIRFSFCFSRNFQARLLACV